MNGVGVTHILRFLAQFSDFDSKNSLQPKCEQFD